MNQRPSKSESGTALVEFALVAPVLVILLIGLIDFGRYMYDGILAANAARAGAAYGAQTLRTADDNVGMTAAAQSDSQGIALTVNPGHVCMVNNAPVSCGTTNETVYVQVNTTGTFVPLVTYPGLPSSVTVKGSSMMRVEQQ